VCIAVFTLDAGLLARSQYSEGPATGHLDTGFSWFHCVYKQNAEMVSYIWSHVLILSFDVLKINVLGFISIYDN
jgi:hypothetical protein